MNSVKLAMLTVAAAAWPHVSDAAPPVGWRLPESRDSYLMEDDLVYARFVALARDGTYRQINRDARGSIEVDRGRWAQDAAGELRLRSSCHALRPRTLRSGPLSVTITSPEQIDALPRLVASVRYLLAEYADNVFDVGTLTEINIAGVPSVQMDGGSVTFDRADADRLATRASEALESERSGEYRLVPVRNSPSPLFTLPDNAFQEADLADVRRLYKAGSRTAPPFYFARIDARKYVAEVGRLQPLHLPGTLE